jgi:nucleotide-binding universal stress UspA family protein
MTEQQTNGRPVVVGVGTTEVDSALEYAAEEAVRAGCGLHLVHAVHLMPDGPRGTLVPQADLDLWGRETLDRAVKTAEELVAGAVPVTHELRHGMPVEVLTEIGATARTLVLEHRHLSRVARVVNRTIAGGVAARVHVPVVAVPSGWKRSGGSPVVVAGVDVPERSAEVLSAAVAESRARGAMLTVVHSWAMPVHYEGVPVEPAEHARWTDRSKAEVRAALDALGDESVAIEAEVVVHPGRAIEAILGAAEGADLLVIGRHDPLVPYGSHIGPVARAVLREATCPVLLASPEASRRKAQPAGISGRHGS